MNRETLIPADCRFTKEHEWVRAAEGIGVIGVTDYAQDLLGDVVFLALPAVGSTVQQMEKYGEIESPKAVSELYAPVSGQVLEVNTTVLARPELVNRDPYGQGWLLRIELRDTGEVANLLSAEAYRTLLEGGARSD